MINKEVWTPVQLNDIPKNKKRKNSFIKSKMLIKQKRDGTVKGRLAAGGHLQDKSVYNVFEELNSPTVSGESTMMVIAIGAAEKRKFVSVDIVGAYLNASMKRDVFMEIENYLAKLLVEIYPDLSKFINVCM